ncbi:MAG: metallopeptidase TldD-related protein, partial [Gammaproteobacteria bacterium]|nr:metallopeptidase TldD-related protein [Gammaproteobacteria bacterium]
MDMPVVFSDREDQSRLESVIDRVLQEAKKQGATSAEVDAHMNAGLSVTSRKGDVETIEHTRDKSMGVTVYFDHCKASASTSDFSDNAIVDAVKAACSIARHTKEDPFSGLADAELMAKNIPDLDLSHPWSLSAEGAIEITKDCEAAALSFDRRITNTEGATVDTHLGLRGYGNSHGFLASYPAARHSLSCSVIASEGDKMQSNYWYSVARKYEELESISSIGRKAAERAISRLGATSIATTQLPVVFSAEVATGLISHFMRAINGNTLYRDSSFLKDMLGEQIFPEFIRIDERPHLKGALGSSPFDNEGVATSARDFITNGVLQSYVLDSYSGRKLNLQTTGNAGGTHNLYVSHSDLTQADLFKKI